MVPLLISAVAFAQPVTGGFGTGLVAGTQALQRFGWVATASIEYVPLADPVPWLGLGAEAALGVQPPWCTRCTASTIARLGAGPVFRRRGGQVMVGARASVLGPRRAIRPFVLTRGELPVGAAFIRPFLWAEGLRATELGVGVELGFRLRDGKLVVVPAPPPPPPAPGDPAEAVHDGAPGASIRP